MRRADYFKELVICDELRIETKSEENLKRNPSIYNQGIELFDCLKVE